MIHGLELLLNSDLLDHGIKTMAVNDCSVTRLFLLQIDLQLAMAVKYWYTIEVGILNNDLWFVVVC